MAPSDFIVLRNMLKERSGIVITPDKEYFIKAQLGPLVRDLKASNILQLISLIKFYGCDELKTAIVEAMTVNKSIFSEIMIRSKISRKSWI